MRLLSSHTLTFSLISCLMAPGGLAKAEPTPLQDFPSASQLWLCHVKGALTAAKREAVLSEGAGTLRILKDHHAAVEKGEVFAIFKPQEIQLERESLQLEKTLFSSKIKEARLDQQEVFLALQSKKAEAQAELLELEAIANEEEVLRDAKLKQRLEEAATATREKIARLEARLALQQASIAEETQIQKLKLDQRRREQDFENSERSAERRAPFAGFFTLSDDLAAEHGQKKAPFEFWVGSTELIGDVTDSSSYEIVLAQYPPILNQVPLEQLILQFQAGSGEDPIQAGFLESRSLAQSGIGGREQRILVFRIGEADRKRAAALAGSTPFGQVFLELPEGCHLVPKVDLMGLLGGKEKQAGGWSAFARSIWPDVELIAAGHLHLALRKKLPDDAAQNPAPESKPSPER